LVFLTAFFAFMCTCPARRAPFSAATMRCLVSSSLIDRLIFENAP
jgi:hypothetical protein